MGLDSVLSKPKFEFDYRVLVRVGLTNRETDPIFS